MCFFSSSFIFDNLYLREDLLHFNLSQPRLWVVELPSVGSRWYLMAGSLSLGCRLDRAGQVRRQPDWVPRWPSLPAPHWARGPGTGCWALDPTSTAADLPSKLSSGPAPFPHPIGTCFLWSCCCVRHSLISRPWTWNLFSPVSLSWAACHLPALKRLLTSVWLRDQGQ